MGSFSLRRLQLKNFRSFIDSTIDFQPTGFCLIRGFNLDTGGSSYSGKSSIGVGVQLALGSCPFPVKDQQSWGTKSAMSVTLDFETDEGIWVLKRGDKSSLKPPKGDTITGSSAVDMKLRQVLGVDPEVLMALTYRGQDEHGLFLSKTDAEKKEFLSKVLGLGAIEAAAERAGELVKEQESRAGVSQFKIQQLEAQLRGMPEIEFSGVDEEPLAASIEVAKASLQACLQKTQCQEGLIETLVAELATTRVRVEDAFKPKISDARANVEKVGAASVIRLALPSKPVPPAQSPEREAISTQIIETRQRRMRLDEIEAARRLEFDANCRKLDQEIADLVFLARGKKRVANELDKKVEQINALQAATCPTCQQGWVTDSAQKQLGVWWKEREALSQQLLTVAAAEESLPQKQAQRNGMRFEADPKVARFQELTVQLSVRLRELEMEDGGKYTLLLSEHVAEVKRLEAENRQAWDASRQAITEAELALACIQTDFRVALSEAVEVIEGRLRNERQALQGLRSVLMQAQQAVYQGEATLKATQAENGVRRREMADRVKAREDVRAELTDVTEQLAKERVALAAEQDFEEFIGYKGFLGSIFDEVLAEITEETNTILGGIANTSHVTLHFASEVLPQKGGAPRREIKPIISISGFQATLRSGASGGMRSGVYLAVDLAVAKVVSRRTNSWPGWIFLDESFNGMDMPSRETCMGMLKRYAGDRLLLVVDHATELKELFETFIDVEFANGRSTIRSQP